MEIYLDANATTPTHPIARDAAMQAMSVNFGNPSSTHSRGLIAKSLIDEVRATATRILGAESGRLLFVSGATEAIQTAILSALTSLRDDKPDDGRWLLYGATEHKAVPEALAYWNSILGLNREIRAIPVDVHGRHDLAWLRRHAAKAALVCTMAANNETGVISDLAGIAETLRDSTALWLVDGVQALGKLSLRLGDLPIDYALFSGHKLYTPKGIGLMYVRHGAPFTPLIVGGGQEGALRSGTENMAGIAALGAILSALEKGEVFQNEATLELYRDRLTSALRDAFPQLVFNAPQALCLPTTLNFSVPGVSSAVLLNLFDAGGVRVSGASACGAAKAKPSHVLTAMGLSDWQLNSAIRMSFGPADELAFIDEACVRIRACGESLRRNYLSAPHLPGDASAQGLTRFTSGDACCYLFAEPQSRCCVVVDPLPALLDELTAQLISRNHAVAAVLVTDSNPEHILAASTLRAALPQLVYRDVDTMGWPLACSELTLADWRMERLAATDNANTAYLLSRAGEAVYVFTGSLLQPDNAMGLRASLKDKVKPHTLLLPNMDSDGRIAATIAQESAAKQSENAEEHVDITLDALKAWSQQGANILVLDIREAYEQDLGSAPDFGVKLHTLSLPPSRLPGMLPELLANQTEQSLVFVCRSGKRSARTAQALRRLGHQSAWSLSGGMALCGNQQASEENVTMAA